MPALDATTSVLLVLATGLVGLALIPLGLPGLWVIVLGILGFGWLTDFRSIGIATIAGDSRRGSTRRSCTRSSCASSIP